MFVFFLQDATRVCQLPGWLLRLADPGYMKIQLSWFGSLESFLCPERKAEDPPFTFCHHRNFAVAAVSVTAACVPVPLWPTLRLCTLLLADSSCYPCPFISLVTLAALTGNWCCHFTDCSFTESHLCKATVTGELCPGHTDLRIWFHCLLVVPEKND